MSAYPCFELSLKQIGFAESRTAELSNAIGDLHAALCKLDSAHIHEIKKLGIGTMIIMFSNTEQLRDPLA